MIEYKVGTNALVAVRLLTTLGVPVTGVVFGGVTATIQRSDLTTVSVNPASGAFWSEVTFGAFAGQGIYNFVLPASVITVPGILLFVVVAGGTTYQSYINVVANIESDTYAEAQITAKIATGRWRIFNNQLMVYDADDTTVLYRFNLLDQNEDPTNTNVFERVPA